MDVPAFFASLEAEPDYAGQLSHVEVLPAREGIFAEPDRPLPEELRRLLAARGIEQLFSHQARALDLARAGRDLAIVTGTATGKTLAFNLPILETVLADPEARALYLYPTKALAQDQMKGLTELLSVDAELSARVLPGVYDGDTPPPQRRRIKAEANLVLSNPDMLHASLLPYHPKWSRFFGGLRYIVLDEVHQYRGILGANVGCVLRRLERVAAHYGARPIYLCASATIANPGEFVARLIGRDVEVIDEDGAPRGRKFFAFWNPSPLGKDHLARRSAGDDATHLLVRAMEQGAQALAFTRTRQGAELIHRYAKESLAAQASPLAGQIRAYRGGYLPNERREIEQGLFSGKLRAAASTNALELGVDIGSLDVVLLVGYPGTIASTWQQAGRSGRRGDDSLAILIAANDPIDQYLLRHPEYFWSQSPEHAVVDPENPYVLANHLQAAAFELPLDEADVASFGALTPQIAEVLVDSGSLAAVAGRYYFSGAQNPSSRMNLRHMSDNTFAIVLWRKGSRQALLRPHFGVSSVAEASGLGLSSSGFGGVTYKNPTSLRSATEEPVSERPATGGSASKRPTTVRALPPDCEVIANVDAISAPELVYPEGVYLHNGEPYFVRELDLSAKVAYVERHEMDYYTQAVLDSKVQIKTERCASSALRHAALHYGDVDVTWQTIAYKKIKFGTRENIGYGPVDIPAQLLPTTALWLVPGDELKRAMKLSGVRTSEGLCGLRNLAIVALPMIAMCDSRDTSGVVDSQNLGRSALVLYDRYPGGLGYCEKGFYQIQKLLELCWQMVRECDCTDGCPSCVGLPNLRPAIHSDPDLTRGYPIPNKTATVRLLELLCEGAGATSQVAADQPTAESI